MPEVWRISCRFRLRNPEGVICPNDIEIPSGLSARVSLRMNSVAKECIFEQLSCELAVQRPLLWLLVNTLIVSLNSDCICAIKYRKPLSKCCQNIFSVLANKLRCTRKVGRHIACQGTWLVMWSCKLVPLWTILLASFPLFSVSHFTLHKMPTASKQRAQTNHLFHYLTCWLKQKCRKHRFFFYTSECINPGT